MRYSRVVAYDLETTGFSPSKNEILEIAAVVWSPDNPEEVWSTLVKPCAEIPKHITELTGISTQTLSKESFLPLKEALVQFEQLITPDTLLVSHNGIAFDNPFLQANGLRLDPKRCWDTLLQTRADFMRKRGRTWKATQDKAKMYRAKQKTNLLAAAEYYKIQKPTEIHRAAADALTCLRIFKKQLVKNKWAIWQQ